MTIALLMWAFCYDVASLLQCVYNIVLHIFHYIAKHNHTHISADDDSITDPVIQIEPCINLYATLVVMVEEGYNPQRQVLFLNKVLTWPRM